MSNGARLRDMPSSFPDIETVADIERFVSQFYATLLSDEQLSPIFLDVAGVDLSVHKPLIISYWEKLLLGGRDYQRHTMNIHRNVHNQRALRAEDFARWLAHFDTSMDALFDGPRAARAKLLANRIAENMHSSL